MRNLDQKQVLVLCTAPVGVCVHLLVELKATFPGEKLVLFASDHATDTLRAETGLEVITYSGRTIHVFNKPLRKTLLRRRFDKVVYLYETWWHDSVRITLLYLMALLNIRFSLFQKTKNYIKEEVFKEPFETRGSRLMLVSRLLIALPAFLLLSFLRKIYPVLFYGFNGSYGDILLDSYYLYVNNRVSGTSRCLTYFLRKSDNTYLTNKVRIALPVFSLGRQLHELAFLFNKGQKFTAQVYEKLQQQALEKGNGLPQMITFTSSEERAGQRLLEKMGLAKGGYALIHSRDTLYFKEYYSDVDDVHSLNDENLHRDADFNYMLPACRFMEDYGLDIMRYGRNHAALTGEIAKHVYDYPNSAYRSDIMDFYIAAKCRFFIGSCSGACNVTYIFKKPFLFINVSNLFMLARREAVISHLKRFYDLKTGTPLTLRQLCEKGLHKRFYHASEYTDLGVGISENTPEELKNVVEEMVMRLEGKWVDTGDDEAARREFDAIYLHYRRQEIPAANIYAPISTSFLRRNQSFIS